MTLRATLTAVEDLDRSRLGGWRDLVSRSADPNPYFEPCYLQATVRHRRIPVTLLMVSEGTDLVACLPLYLHLRVSRLGWPVWGMPNVLGVPHVDPACSEAALRTGIDYLENRWGPRRLLRLFRVPAEGVAGPALLAAVRAMRCGGLEPDPVTCPMIRRRPSPTYLEESLGGPTRSKIRQKRRNLQKLLGGQLRVVDRGGDPSAVERFLALEASGWKGRGGTAMLSQAGEADFFRAVCTEFSAAGRLRLLSLETGSTVVAMRCDVAAGDGLFSLKTSYDEQYARFSPGLLLDVDGIRLFHESAAAWLNSTTNGLSSPVFLLYPDRQTLVDAVVGLGPLTRRVIRGLTSSGVFGRRRAAGSGVRGTARPS